MDRQAHPGTWFADRAALAGHVHDRARSRLRSSGRTPLVTRTTGEGGSISLSRPGQCAVSSSGRLYPALKHGVVHQHVEVPEVGLDAGDGRLDVGVGGDVEEQEPDIAGSGELAPRQRLPGSSRVRPGTRRSRPWPGRTRSPGRCPCWRR